MKILILLLIPLNLLSQSYMTRFRDSIVYTHYEKDTMRFEGDVIPPLRYSLEIPSKAISSYSLANHTCVFQYSNKQILYLYYNRFSDNDIMIFKRIRNPEEIRRLLLGDLNMANSVLKLDEENNSFNYRRETYVAKHGKMTILLYNIKRKRVKKFFKSSQTFRFL